MASSNGVLVNFYWHEALLVIRYLSTLKHLIFEQRGVQSQYLPLHGTVWNIPPFLGEITCGRSNMESFIHGTQMIRPLWFHEGRLQDYLEFSHKKAHFMGTSHSQRRGGIFAGQESRRSYSRQISHRKASSITTPESSGTWSDFGVGGSYLN